MSLFLAIDAGGTKADYVLADSSRVLARARSNTIKRMRVEEASATRHLEDGLRALSTATGADLRDVACTCIGTAGNTVPLVVDWLREALGARVGGRLLLLGDVEIALDAAFPGQAGVLALAGTGSNVAGRSLAGVFSTAGGWGPALSDQGSGHRIGSRGLRAAVLARDAGRENQLLDVIQQFWGVATFDGLVAFANSTPAPDFSRLTPLVVRCAEAGDPVAQEVLVEQGEELGAVVRLMVRRLRAQGGRTSHDPWTPPLAFAGSILENVGPVREALLADVRREFPAVLAREGVVDPVQGALARARMGR